MKKGLIIGLVIVVLLLFGVFSSYNGLVSLNEDVNGKWSQVENQLQRRADLIPNLVATVKGYAAQEQTIFTAVAEARSKLLNAQGPASSAQADGELTSALGRLLAIAESYPQLKSDANFRQLQDELAGTENRIAVARKDYNDSVQVYNTKIKRFPTNLFAGILGFPAKEYFQAQEGAQEVPQVEF
ncbi:LemA family protein [Candidatus Formimonas warabiya]|uniref:LemA family protein n=1 Tax=Formimonas warabiya TaxID=1761012 RepID=A0A3G1KV19_FORW1|nr:LemA family protein [Candidatus Formimonas warabiya]ATW26045.1 LemA family protein [Candidatus Formimonas warabiya]